MGFCVVVNLLNPLIMESAVDDYISKGNFRGLGQLIGFAVILNILMVLGIKLRMYVMAKVCNSIPVSYTHLDIPGRRYLIRSIPSGRSFIIMVQL